DAAAQERARNIVLFKMQGTEAELRTLRIDLSAKKLDLDNMKARLEKIADEPVSAADLRGGLREAKYLASGLTARLKPYLDVQSKLDSEFSAWAIHPDSPDKRRELKKLEDIRNANQAVIDVEEAKIRGELEK